MKKTIVIIGLCFICFLIFFKKNEKKTNLIPSLPREETATPPQIVLKKATFSDLKNWNNDNLALTLSGFNNSCIKILSENTTYLSNAEIKLPTASYREICRQFIASQPENTTEFKNFLEKNFTPFLVTDNGNEEGKFTSYFESSLNASYTKNEKYKYPIYGKPYDLIELNTRDFNPDQPNRRFVGRIENQKLVPYFTRKEIEQNNINAPVILWGDSNIDINIMQIQGSAVAKLDDGREVRVGYADNNGHPFKGIGSILLSKGLGKPGQASMSHIKQWLKQNPQLAEENLYENNRYIFHRLVNADGPIGAHGVPLHAGRSLAVDKKYIPLGSLIWLETTGPDKEKIEKLVVAQDIGSAIKGIVRGDYFWGSGADEILDKAGKMNSSGKYYILIPKNAEQNYEHF